MIFNLASPVRAAENAVQGERKMMLLLMILLVVLPYGTALICGAITYRAGDIVSGWCSVGGLALGIYFFHKSMELLGPS
jgi:integral membrane sensor domain MASE1